MRSAGLAVLITMSLPALGSNVHTKMLSEKYPNLLGQLRLPQSYALHISTYIEAATRLSRFYVCVTNIDMFKFIPQRIP
jgi:hypothetical protein